MVSERGSFKTYFNVSMLSFGIAKISFKNASCVAEIFREKPLGDALGNLRVNTQEIYQDSHLK